MVVHSGPEIGIEVDRRQHRVDTGRAPCRPGVNAHDAAGGYVAAQEGDVDLTRQADVIGKAAAASDQPGILPTFDPLAHEPGRTHPRCGGHTRPSGPAEVGCQPLLAAVTTWFPLPRQRLTDSAWRNV